MKGLKLNREKFFDNYRERFGRIRSQKTVDGLTCILDRFENETRLPNIPAFAYTLTTAKHESGRDGVEFQPVREKRASQTRNPEIWKLQKAYWGTGFYGRGLVQTTHEENYRKVGEACGVGDLFVKEPDKLLELHWAYEALIVGMTRGLYRTDRNGIPHTIDRYFSESKPDYYDAREIVNGDKRKNGKAILEIAENFEEILRESLIKEGEDVVQDKTPPVIETSVPMGTAPDDAPVEIQQSKKGKGGIIGIITAVATWLSATGLKLSGIELTNQAIIGLCGLVGIGLVVGGWLWNQSSKRAHERTLLEAQLRADPDKYNVTIK